MIALQISDAAGLSRHAQVCDQSKCVFHNINLLVGVQVTEPVAEWA